jgi:hypothetical protein
LVEWPEHDAPAARNFDIGGKAADRQDTAQGIGVASDVDDRDGMAERVGDVERGAIGADCEVADWNDRDPFYRSRSPRSA